jgi:tetratricopeptide (TPR) repeat protein
MSPVQTGTGHAPGVTERPCPLLDKSMAKYRHNLSESTESAQDRYGFTLFHSLRPEEKVQHIEKLGFEARDAIDHYNLGSAAALQENFEVAVKQLQRAVELDPQFADAVHNLALALERAGRVDDAKGQWRRYLELSPAGESRSMAEAHLHELG